MDTEKTMEAIDVYLMYCAMKAHFNSDYDFIKYDGKTKIKRDSFYKRKDRSFFVKIAKKYTNPKDYFIANFTKNKKGYVADFTDEIFESWQLKRQGFFNMFEVELSPFVKEFEPLFSVENSQHPKLLKEFLGSRVSLETLIILDELVSYTDKWDKHLNGDIIWTDLKKLMNNYKRFLTIDKNRYRIALLKLIEESK